MSESPGEPRPDSAGFLSADGRIMAMSDIAIIVAAGVALPLLGAAVLALVVIASRKIDISREMTLSAIMGLGLSLACYGRMIDNRLLVGIGLVLVSPLILFGYAIPAVLLWQHSAWVYGLVAGRK